MKRRRFIYTAAAVATLLPLAAYSQQKLRRVGLLSVGPPPPKGTVPPVVSEVLQAGGFVEGQNIAYEARNASAGSLSSWPLA
jgi:hypothetical protein